MDKLHMDTKNYHVYLQSLILGGNQTHCLWFSIVQITNQHTSVYFISKIFVFAMGNAFKAPAKSATL